jgi:hypothetical protein
MRLVLASIIVVLLYQLPTKAQTPTVALVRISSGGAVCSARYSPAKALGLDQQSSSSPDTQAVDHVLIDADHAFTLEGTRGELATAVMSWLTAHCR